MGKSEAPQLYAVEPPIEIELSAEEALYLENMDLQGRVLELEAENHELRQTVLELRQEAFEDHLKRRLGVDPAAVLSLDLG